MDSTGKDLPPGKDAMSRLHPLFYCVFLTISLAAGLALTADPPRPNLSPPQLTAIAEVVAWTDELKQINRAIWEFAELGLQEHRSSELLQSKLRSAGFQVTAGVSGMPTAFVATFGSGSPVIGILAEYDALPGMSQKVEPVRAAVKPGASGHACGHCGLGAGAVGAAIAAKASMQKHNLKGTIRLYGTPAEETVIGKVYMLLDGRFDDLDICLHWHPSAENSVWAASSKALVSARFTFTGTSSHASGSPESGRSALDAVELMNVAVNYMREHVKEDARLHYVITDGGGAPNVVPARAAVWYYIRADSHEDVEYNFQWVQDIAKGAAMMTRTNVEVHVETDCHELIPNGPLSKLLQKRLTDLDTPTFTDEELEFARQLQQPLVDEFGTEFPLAIDESVRSLDKFSEPSKGSTDVGDISWHVPTGGIRTTCFAAKSPGHSWQNTACIASTIGEKGIVYAARVLATTAIDLLENPQHVAEAKADWEKRMKIRSYKTLIPKGQKAIGNRQ